MTENFRFSKTRQIDHFRHFELTFVHSKCNCSSLRSQYWMRLFWRFLNTVRKGRHIQWNNLNFSTKRILFSCKSNLKLHNFQSSSLFSFEFPFSSSSTGISIVQFLKVSAPACNKIMHFFCTKAKNTTFPFVSRHPLRRFKSKMTFYRVHICVSESKAKKAEKRHLWLLREKFLGNKNILHKLILDCLNKISDKSPILT